MSDKSDHDMLIEIHAVLLGANGHKGLCEQFEEHKKSDGAFRSDYYKFKRWAIGVFCFLVGSGVITIGAINIF